MTCLERELPRGMGILPMRDNPAGQDAHATACFRRSENGSGSRIFLPEVTARAAEAFPVILEEILPVR